MKKIFFCLTIAYLHMCSAQLFNWTTFQNISPAGQNSILSSFAMNDNGQAVAAWAREDTIIPGIYDVVSVYSIDAGQTWSSPVVLSQTTEVVTLVQVVINNLGHAICQWVFNNVTSFASDIKGNCSLDGGKIWNNFFNLTNGAFNDIFYGTIALNDNDFAISVFQENSISPQIYFSESTDAGLNWTSPATILSASAKFKPQLALDNNNQVLVAWLQDSPPTIYTANLGSLHLWFISTISVLTVGGELSLTLNNNNLAYLAHANAGGVMYIYESKDAGISWPVSWPDAIGQTDSKNVRIKVNNSNKALIEWIENATNIAWISYYFDVAERFWSIPFNLYSPTILSHYLLDLSLNDSDIALSVWFNPANFNIMTSSSKDAGVTWSSPQTIILPSPTDINNLQVILNDAGQGLPGWYGTYSTNIVQTAFSSIINGLNLKKSSTNLLLQKDFFAQISWNPIPNAIYRIYADKNKTELLHEGTASNFCQHGLKADQTVVYYLTWILNGIESFPIEIRF